MRHGTTLLRGLFWPPLYRDGGDGGGGGGAGGGGEKTFTQDELDRIVGQRVASERKKYPDYDELKAKAAKADELESAQKSELQKANDRAEKAEKERDTAIAERDAAKEEAQESKIAVEVLAEAQKAGAIDPRDVLGLLPKGKVTIGDDGQVAGHEDAVKALLEGKPHLVGKAQQGTTSATRRDGGAQRTTGPGPDQVSPGQGRLRHAYDQNTDT